MSVSYVNKGTFASGTGGLTVGVPSGYTAGNLFLLFVESANQSISTPSGWTEVITQVGTGTAAAAGGVRLAVFSKTVTASESSVSVTDTGDHTTAIIMEFSSTEGTPEAAVSRAASSVDSTATSTITCPSVTTSVANALIVGGIGLDKDANDTDTITGTWTNANLSSITERHDQSVSSGVGGGIAVVTGTKATAGSTGTTTNTADSSTTHAYITIALQDPQKLVCSVGTFTETGVSQTLKWAHELDTSAGSFTLASGGNATLTKGAALNHYTLTCNAGTFTVDALEVELNNFYYLLPGSGLIALSDRTLLSSGLFNPIPSVSLNYYTLTCNTGTFTETGISQTFSLARKIICSTGNYTETGIQSTLSLARKIIASVGNYILTGINSTLIFNRSLICQYGAYTLAGISQTLLLVKKLITSTGSYVETGINADLTKSGTLNHYTLVCNSGAFTEIGQHISLNNYNYVLPDIGIVSTSDTVTLSTGLLNPIPTFTTGAFALICNVGSYTVTGIATTLTKTTSEGYALTCSTGIFNVSTVNAGLSRTGRLVRSATSNIINITGYTNAANAYISNDIYATAAPSKNNEVSSYFGFDGITSADLPDNAVITNVYAICEFKVSTTSSIATQYIQLFDGGAPLGTEASSTSEPLIDTNLASWTTGQSPVLVPISSLRVANTVLARLRSRRGNSNTAVTFSIDSVTLIVEWKDPTILTSSAGNYTVTGNTAIIEKSYQRNLICSSGTYATTLQDITLIHGISSDTFVVPGGIITIGSDTLYPSIGLFSFIKQSATGAYVLTCSSGTFICTGINADISSSINHYVLVCNNGNYTVIENTAEIKPERVIVSWLQFIVPIYILTSDSGIFSLTGTAATLTLYNKVLSCNRGSYYLTGVASTLNRGRTLTCNSGSFNVTGIASTLTKTTVTQNRTLTCNVGTYTTIGIVESLFKGSKLIGESNSFTVTGYISNNKLGKYLSCLKENYNINTITSSLTRSFAVICGTGVYIIEGHPMFRDFEALSGSFIVGSTEASLNKAILFSCVGASYNIISNNIDLWKSSWVDIQDPSNIWTDNSRPNSIWTNYSDPSNSWYNISN